MRIFFVLVLIVGFSPIFAHSGPITFGALSSNDNGNTEVIRDSLNDLEWLRWDVLDELTYAQTVAAISSSGAYSGWSIAGISEANLFLDALLLGRSNACSPEQQFTTTVCDSLNAGVNLMGLLGNNYEPQIGNLDYTYAWFLSDNEAGQETGYLEYLLSLNPVANGSQVKATYEYRSINNTDDHSADGGAPHITWLLYREATVPIPATIWLFALGLAGIGYMRRGKSDSSSMEGRSLQ